MSGDSSYEVGYGKPPKRRQWRKGQSGNPGGRPRKNASAAALLNAVLSRSVVVREGKRTRRMSRLEVLLRALVDQAVKGESRQIKIVLDEVRKNEARAEAEPPDEMGPADWKVMDALYKRLARDAVEQAAQVAPSAPKAARHE